MEKVYTHGAALTSASAGGYRVPSVKGNIPEYRMSRRQRVHWFWNLDNRLLSNLDNTIRLHFRNMRESQLLLGCVLLWLLTWSWNVLGLWGICPVTVCLGVDGCLSNWGRSQKIDVGNVVGPDSVSALALYDSKNKEGDVKNHD